MSLFLALGSKSSAAGLLASTYDLGDGYTLNLGSKAGGLQHGHNIVGLKKNDVGTEGDTLIFTLARPDDNFGGDGASLGVVYTKALQENVTGSLSLTGGPADGGLSTQDVAMTFRLHVKLQ